jgi:outer membrane immunogenic protein
LALAANMVLAGSVAQAADLGRPVPAPVTAAYPVYPTLWSGLYAGANIGYGWGDTSGTYTVIGGFVPAPAGAFGSPDIDGLTAGGQIGYAWQTGQWVWGIEADFDWSGIDGSHSNTYPGFFFGFLDLSVASKVDVNWVSTVRGRVGWAPDRWHIYATGGIAFADFDVKINDSFLGSASDGSTRVGWTLGAGVEYALTDNWRLGLEYKYLDFGKETYTGPSFGPFTSSTKVDFNINDVSLRLNYRF